MYFLLLLNTCGHYSHELDYALNRCGQNAHEFDEIWICRGFHYYWHNRDVPLPNYAHCSGFDEYDKAKFMSLDELLKSLDVDYEEKDEEEEEEEDLFNEYKIDDMIDRLLYLDSVYESIELLNKREVEELIDWLLLCET